MKIADVMNVFDCHPHCRLFAAAIISIAAHITGYFVFIYLVC